MTTCCELDNAAARRTQEDERVALDVYAIEVEHADTRWIMDGRGHLDEADILASAAADVGRTPGGFTAPWALSAKRLWSLAKLLDQSFPAIDQVIAAWQAHGLQCTTLEASKRPSLT